MADNSKIQWTNATWNPWQGCTKVSPGCKYCYMYRDKERYKQDPYTPIRSKNGTFNKPLTWKEPRLIFTCSWSDWFIEDADKWRDEAWDIIRKTPQHTYQILTKRPERIKQCLPDDWGEGWDNVWLGVSVENQSVVAERLHFLINAPAKIRFLSAEPLIDYVNLNGWVIKPNRLMWNLIHWVIIGGESGNDSGKYRYRKAELDWFEFLINQCKRSEIPVFVKQLGTHLAKELNLSDRHGGNMGEWPEWLQVREMPKSYNPVIPDL